MQIDRAAQNARAKRLYEADPGRRDYGDSNCWVAACFTAYDLVMGDFTALRFKELVDYYGLEAVDG